MSILTSLGTNVLKGQEAILKLRGVGRFKRLLFSGVKKIPGMPQIAGGAALMGGAVGLGAGTLGGYAVGRRRRKKYTLESPGLYPVVRMYQDGWPDLSWDSTERALPDTFRAGLRRHWDSWNANQPHEEEGSEDNPLGSYEGTHPQLGRKQLRLNQDLASGGQPSVKLNPRDTTTGPGSWKWNWATPKPRRLNQTVNFSNQNPFEQLKKSYGGRWSEMDVNDKRRLVNASIRSGREKAHMLAGITREEHGL